MVRYERPNVLRRCLPLVRGLPREGARPHVLRLILALGAWGLAFALMVVCAFISSFRYPKGTEALPDLTYSLVPHHVVHPLPDILLYTLMASVVGRMIFHPEGIAIARRFAAIASCIYVFRSIALISTSFPDPQSKCEDYDPSWNLGVFLKHSCGGDMMGHTVNLALAGLVWSQYTKHKLLYLVAWLTSFAAMVLFIVNRSHYTIDVLISLFISVSCWKYYHSTLLLPPQHQNSLIKWLEKTNHEPNDLTRGNQGNIQGQGGLTLASVTSHVTSALASNPLTLVTPLNPLSGPSKYQVLSEDSKYNDDNITGSPGTSP